MTDRKLGIEGNFLKLIGNVYKRTTTNIITGKKLDVFSLR